MQMKNISVHECREGDIIAKDIISGSGILILAENTIINSYIQSNLSKFGISSIWIYEFNNDPKVSSFKSIQYESFLEDYHKSITVMKDIILDLTTGRPLNTLCIDELSKLIKSKIDQATHITDCLRVIKSSDEYTYTHCINTAFYSMIIAKWMRLTEGEIEKAIKAGLLHDIGKTQVATDILNKKGILTREEFDIIQKHTILGYGILNDIDDIDIEIKHAVLLHHERIDGSGYPLSASPKHINIYARIVAVADVFDAMTSDRVYKKRATPFDVFEMLNTVGIGIFDTSVIHAFLKNMAYQFVGSNVLLNDGRTGKVVYVPPQDIISPVINVKSEFIDLSQQEELKVVSLL
jgi:putative nucleotidyltransferase with HDIG domain